MDWIGEKIEHAQEEAAKIPVRERGYDVGIYVEGRWLQQLIAESISHYQMVVRLQRDLARMSMVNYGDSLLNKVAPQQPIVFPTEKK